jgi:hypothetical protein
MKSTDRRDQALDNARQLFEIDRGLAEAKKKMKALKEAIKNLTDSREETIARLKTLGEADGCTQVQVSLADGRAA